MSASETDLPADVPTPGQIIAGKYEVERVLGVGGMGVVLAARHLQLPQRVAIKFMRVEAARDPNAVERFLREARAAVALSSEHVTRVLDVGTLATGEPYMVMEYLDGIDLSQVISQRGPMPVAEAVGSVLQACEAIAEAHAMGIVHRDLKPANLFLGNLRDGTTTVKVLDFGISKVSDFNSSANSNLTASGLVMGSPGYMSPEQVRSAKGVDARTDIWALGVILYELTTGVRPFEGETMGELLALIVSETPVSVRQHRPEIPEGLATVIAQCLERRVDRRIQDVGELASKLVTYCPRGGPASLERIRRWRTARTDASQGGSGTLTAGGQGGAVGETETPWLRSASAETSLFNGRRRMVLGSASAAVVIAVVASAFVIGGRVRSAPRPSVAASATALAVVPAPLPSHLAAQPQEVLVAEPGEPAPVVAILPEAGPSAMTGGGPQADAAVPSDRRGPKPPPRRVAPGPTRTPTNNETDLF